MKNPIFNLDNCGTVLHILLIALAVPTVIFPELFVPAVRAFFAVAAALSLVLFVLTDRQAGDGSKTLTELYTDAKTRKRTRVTGLQVAGAIAMILVILRTSI